MRRLILAVLLAFALAPLAVSGDAIHKTERDGQGRLLMHRGAESEVVRVWNCTKADYLYGTKNTPEGRLVLEDAATLLMAGIPPRYWKVVGDRVVERTQGEKDQADADQDVKTQASLREHILTLSAKIVAAKDAVAWLVTNGKNTTKAQVTLDAFNAERDALLPQLP